MSESELEEKQAKEHIKQLAIIEKYEQLINYLYPILQNTPRKHGIVRDSGYRVLFNQVELIIAAAKSNQVSRIYSADANLALLRFWLRFVSDPRRKIITSHQHRHAQAILAEVGGMIGAWIRTSKCRG